MERALVERIGAELGSPVLRARAIAGGDINAAHALELRDGRHVFVKTQARGFGDGGTAPALRGGASLPGLFAHEASGLRWLAEPRALRTPEVLALSDEPGGAFLALELIATGAPARDHDEQLGRGLAALHQSGAPSFGLAYDNYLATLPQLNQPLPSWPRFYAERRLQPLLARAIERGCASARMRRGLERVIASIDALCGDPEPPARLHGDLWGGNALCDERGAPVLIDPAVYGGHREIDLAMMRLFGGFSARVFAAYEEAYPLGAGHEERVALYQLYPLLAHVSLFGSSYVSSVERALDALD